MKTHGNYSSGLGTLMTQERKSGRKAATAPRMAFTPAGNTDWSYLIQT